MTLKSCEILTTPGIPQGPGGWEATNAGDPVGPGQASRGDPHGPGQKRR